MSADNSGHKYPLWQVIDGKPLPRLKQIADYLQSDEWDVYRFLTEPLDALHSSSPIDAVRRGEIDRVVDIAKGIAQGGFL